MNNKLKVHPSKYNEFGDTIENDGMDLRDYFANSAMQASIANPTMWNDLISDSKKFGKELTTLEYIAKECYEIADAMLKQREL